MSARRFGAGLFCFLMLSVSAQPYAIGQEEAPSVESIHAVSEWGTTIAKNLMRVLEMGARPERASEISLGAAGELAGAGIATAAGAYAGWAVKSPLAGLATGAVLTAVLGGVGEHEGASVGRGLDAIRATLRDQFAQVEKLGQERDHLNNCLAAANASGSAAERADIRELRAQLGTVGLDLSDLENAISGDLSQMAAILPVNDAVRIKKVDLPSFGARLSQDFQTLDEVAASSENAYDCGLPPGPSPH